MPRMSGAQALVRQLGSEGVSTVFGLPGVQMMAAFDALYEVQDDIRIRLCYRPSNRLTPLANLGLALVEATWRHLHLFAFLHIRIV